MQVRMIGGVAIDSAPNVERLDTMMFAEQFALWSLRFWYRCVAADVHPQAKLMEAYGIIGDEDGAVALDDAMWTIFSCWRGPRRIQSTRSMALSEDEKRILDLVATAQHGLSTSQRARVAELVPPNAEDCCLERIRAWAESLSTATLILPIRDWHFQDTLRETETTPGFNLVPAAPMRH